VAQEATFPQEGRRGRKKRKRPGKSSPDREVGQRARKEYKKWKNEKEGRTTSREGTQNKRF